MSSTPSEPEHKKGFKKRFPDKNKFKGKHGFRKGQNNKKTAKDRGLMPLPDDVEAQLVKLRKKLNSSGKPVEEIKQTLRQERRKAENEFRKQLKNACYRCRDPGHKLSECPKAEGDMDTMTDVCFKCGSAEHNLSECKSKKTELDFVRCFVCSERGHISRDCPKNTKGVYPKGGSCKICKSVNHLAKDCPDAVKDGEEPEEEITLGTLSAKESADADDLSRFNKNKKKPKVVNF
ncbi:zinc finger CCHC domain-containing protein 9 [Tetranychus urticae]|uniref:CCHC-type domain-containing protein n=1 Tax=Tetranychus urticae TaxID=32264 RepID=T1JZV1_TETUR|nr:zinc finger CCHC domain-containing protein 9 [Tetranychus urticae]